MEKLTISEKTKMVLKLQGHSLKYAQAGIIHFHHLGKDYIFDNAYDAYYYLINKAVSYISNCKKSDDYSIKQGKYQNDLFCIKYRNSLLTQVEFTSTSAVLVFGNKDFLDVSDLQEESKRYEDELNNMQHAVGEYCLIYKNDDILYFPSFNDALEHGNNLYGLEPFLVRQVRFLFDDI